MGKWRVWIISGWGLLTATLALWWMIYFFRNLDLIATLDIAAVTRTEILRQQRMIFLEGLTLIALIVIGFVTLLFDTWKERRQLQLITRMVASLNHDIKTSIASLRLRSEALEDSEDHQACELAKKIVNSTVKLETQLENTIMHATMGDLELYREPIDLADLLNFIQIQWPDLQLKIEGQAEVYTDRRILRSVISNLMMNCQTHAGAKTLNVEIQVLKARQHNIQLSFSNENPHPKAAFRAGPGLSVSKRMIDRLGGSLEVLQSEQEFCVKVTLPGVEKNASAAG